MSAEWSADRLLEIHKNPTKIVKPRDIAGNAEEEEKLLEIFVGVRASGSCMSIMCVCAHMCVSL